MNIFTSIAIFFFMFLTSGCGTQKKAEVDAFGSPLDDSFPTLKNTGKWEKLWDGSTWILALDTKLTGPTEKETLRRNIVDSVMGHIGKDPKDEKNKSLFQLLDSQLILHVNAFSFLDRIKTDEKLTGFAFVTFPESESLWSQLQQAPETLLSGNSSLLKRKIFLQWNSLEKVQGVQWVEPNLQNELFQSTPYVPPPEVEKEAEFASILQRIHALDAYRFAAESGLKQNPVIVAVLDTGVDYEHPDLKNKMFANPSEIVNNGLDDDKNGYVDDIFGINATLNPGEIDIKGEPVPGPADVGGPGNNCPDELESDPLTSKCGHGTHVAGIIAAEQGGDLTTLGVCPQCKIVSLRVAKRCARENENGKYFVNCGIDDASQIRALQYILNLKTQYIQILNMSLGKYLKSRAMAFHIRNLQKNGLLVIAAAGNDNTESPNFPAAYSSVLGVCATSNASGRGDFAKADFSNFGEWVDICAPGTNIFSTFPGGNSRYLSGTSQATPVVAGAAGFLLSLNPQLTSEEVIDILKLHSNSRSLYEDEKLNFRYRGEYPDGTKFFMLGSGFLDLEGALRKRAKTGVTEALRKPQVTEGCLIGNIGTRQHAHWNFIGSMPFLLGMGWIILSLGLRIKRKLS
jgi:hypothetical protein